MLGATPGSLQLYFFFFGGGGPTAVNEGGRACNLHWNQAVTFICVINAVIRHLTATVCWAFQTATISLGLHSNTAHYLMSSSVLFLFGLWGNSHLKIRLWHLSKLLSPREHTHPPVGRLKRAIDSSKKSQIKTRLQTVGRKKKKTAPPQSNVKRLATWKREVVQRVVRKKDEV